MTYSVCHSPRMHHNWPEEEKTNCLICGASFLATTAAETGGICRRHTKGQRPMPGLPPEEDKLFVAISPDGKVIQSAEDLPVLPFPLKMIVRPSYLNFDGWIIRIWPCSKSMLGWISTQAGQWCKENPDPVVKAQVNAMITAIEQQLVHGSDAEICIPESRWKV